MMQLVQLISECVAGHIQFCMRVAYTLGQFSCVTSEQAARCEPSRATVVFDFGRLNPAPQQFQSHFVVREHHPLPSLASFPNANRMPQKPFAGTRSCICARPWRCTTSMD
jgi:hypothetical protein